MSCLSFPRIHFRGVFSTDVDTANNNDIIDAFDPVSSDLVGDAASLPFDEAVKFLMSPVEPGGSIRASWNYYGSHATAFEQARVTSTLVAFNDSPASDPLEGLPVQMGSSAVMVDVDPTGSFGTQIFMGGFSLGDQTLGLRSRNPLTTYSRWLHFGRNPNFGGFTGAAATWQLAIPNADLAFLGAAKSPALAELQNRAQQGLGVLVQFNTYLVQPVLTQQELYERFFKQGKFRSNPARGFVVGTVGVWEPSDFETAPNGRRLNPEVKVNVPVGSRVASVSLGPCAVAFDEPHGIVSLNLITTFPNVGGVSPAEDAAPQEFDGIFRVAAGPRVMGEDPSIPNLGPMTLMVVPEGDASPVAITGLDGYDSFETYANHGGIFDYRYDASLTETVKRGTLIVQADNPRPESVILRESIIVAETDDRGIYLDPGGTAKVRLRVKERGGPTTARVTFATGIVESGKVPPAPGSLTIPASIEVPVGRTEPVSVQIQANQASLQVVYFFSDQADSRFDPTTGFFTNVRVLPADNFDDVQDDERLSWTFVYEKVLKFYAVLFPVMNDYVDLSNEDAVRNAGPNIRFRVSQLAFNSPLYMPITRSMSLGRRKLLLDWLDANPPQVA